MPESAPKGDFRASFGALWIPLRRRWKLPSESAASQTHDARFGGATFERFTRNLVIPLESFLRGNVNSLQKVPPLRPMTRDFGAPLLRSTNRTSCRLARLRDRPVFSIRPDRRSRFADSSKIRAAGRRRTQLLGI